MRDYFSENERKTEKAVRFVFFCYVVNWGKLSENTWCDVTYRQNVFFFSSRLRIVNQLRFCLECDDPEIKEHLRHNTT
jgi:hypothetical protein